MFNERTLNQGRKGQTYDELINQLIDRIINHTTKDNQDSFDRSFGNLHPNPTTTGQSLPRPGQSAVGDEFSNQGSGPTDG